LDSPDPRGEGGAMGELIPRKPTTKRGDASRKFEGASAWKNGDMQGPKSPWGGGAR